MRQLIYDRQQSVSLWMLKIAVKKLKNESKILIEQKMCSYAKDRTMQIKAISLNNQTANVYNL